jgi:hypothetical protein
MCRSRNGRAAALLVLLFALPAAAQTTASLTGVVTTGDAPVASVTVTITSPALQGARSTITGPSGAYQFSALPPGNYTIALARDGFTTITKNAELHLSQTSRVDAQMFAPLTENIVVSAPPPSVLETTPIATTLPLRELDRLPVLRNQFASAQLAPGVTANTLSGGQLQIAGGSGYDNLVLVNGVVVTENTRSQMRPLYVEDAIEETTLLTGAIPAEYGRFTGGVVNTITRSGGNDFDASLRDSLSNPKWAAQTPALEEREDHLNHVWEATAGGALLRDRLWFFASGRWAKNDQARQTIAIPAFTTNPLSAASPRISYSEGNDQRRYEGKLTSTLGDRHSLVGSYFGVLTLGTNARFNANLYDEASLTEQHDPESLAALHYDGVVTPNVLVQAYLSRRTYSLETGAETTDRIGGTLLLDRANANTRFHAPSRCGVCENERRNNDDVLLKANAFFDSGRFGTHNVVAGVDRFTERHLLEDHQSGSDFSIFVTRAQWKDGVTYPVITPTTANGGGTFIRWSPILTPAAENELRTESAFVNDRWDLGKRWSVSAGVRYDRNHAVDADGAPASTNGRFSPRLSVHFDPRGNGRQRISASFAEYTTRIGDAIASANQLAGNAASIDFAYRGPSINATSLTVSMDDAIRQLFAYFDTQQGGTANTAAINLRANGTRTVPGFNAYFDGSLRSPYVREITLGYGMELGSNAYAKVDFVSREWHDFFAASVTTSTRRATTPFTIPVDLLLIRNSNNIQRTYRGVLLQARWNPSRYQTGVHYTWSKLRGNDEGETMSSGPIPNLDPSMYYSELMDYDRFSPAGYLAGDQRHRVRAWAGATFGPFFASVLLTYDSGLPYVGVAPIAVTRYTGAPVNPGYNAIPNGQYYFTDRGALRTDNVSSTNLALRYTHAFFFAQADVLNIFNRQDIADPIRLGTGITTAASSTTLQPFNPFTTTPVEGTHYQRAANFGQPLNNLAYQTPRTYRASVGVRF